MRWLAVLALALPGCAQILGLSDTKLDQVPVDAPGICDGQPACNFSTGRSLCGRLYNTGADAGTPIQVAAPTGGFCTAQSTDGPCAFTVRALPEAAFFGGSTGGTVGQMDDCGRFVVPDVDPNQPDVAVVFEAQSGWKRNATLVLGRPAVAGADSTLEAHAVSDSTVMMWSTQLATSVPVDVSAAYLVRYTRSGTPIEGEQVAKDLMNPLTNPPGTVPWGAYFSTPFGAIAPGATATSANGTAIAVLGTGTFSLEGLHPGRRCRITGLQQVGATFIFVLPTDC